MKRRNWTIFGAALAAVLLTGAFVSGPAFAANVATATSLSVDLTDTDCETANGDIGLVSEDVATETGVSTLIDGTEIDSWSQASTLSNSNGPHGFGFADFAPVPVGTIIGVYSTVGTAPNDATNTAEYFFLYRCGAGGTSEVLVSCYGQYGSCPTTAAEALTPVIDSTTDPVTAGETETFAATGCWGSTGWARLTAPDDSVLGTVTGLTVAADGSFGGGIAVPADAADGPATLTVGCGTPEEPIGSTATAAVTVIGAVVLEPNFTG